MSTSLVDLCHVVMVFPDPCYFPDRSAHVERGDEGLGRKAISVGARPEECRLEVQRTCRLVTVVLQRIGVLRAFRRGRQRTGPLFRCTIVKSLVTPMDYVWMGLWWIFCCPDEIFHSHRPIPIFCNLLV